MYIVTITPMGQGAEVIEEFATYSKAHNYFMQWCDEHGYEYEYGVEAGRTQTAGGTGHDYRIELAAS